MRSRELYAHPRGLRDIPSIRPGGLLTLFSILFNVWYSLLNVDYNKSHGFGVCPDGERSG